MQDYRSFQKYYVTRGMTSARRRGELERYWRRAQELDLISPKMAELYESKKVEIEQKEKEWKEKEGAKQRERKEAEEKQKVAQAA